MSILLDTNVLSEVIRPRPDRRVLAFISKQADPMISAITIHEIAFGAERARDPSRRSALLSWVAAVRSEFRGRIVSVDEVIADQAGRIRASAQTAGAMVTPMDALIGATALLKGVKLATRNVNDFAVLGVSLINPWDA